jgi:hypothetical protein
VSGSAFNGQPIEAMSIHSQDVQINGVHVVELGGDFWHTDAYPIGQNLAHLICAIGRGTTGVLDSDLFLITQRYLAYRIGGRADNGEALELRIPQLVAASRKLDFPALDAPDADDFVAVRRAVPGRSDVLAESWWDLSDGSGANGLLGSVAKIRLRIDNDGEHRLLVDHLRLLDDVPPPFHPPLWGWADLHCHPMAQAGFGGLLAGHMHGQVEDLGSCIHQHGIQHNSIAHLVPSIVEGSPRGNDGSLTKSGWTVGTPAPGEQKGFTGWPVFDDLTHIKVHQDWIRRAHAGGQRLMVALIVHSELLATLMGAPQTDRDTVEPQVQMLLEFVAHNAAWCGLARTPLEARTLIEQNKLAFVLGIETDSINGWSFEKDFSTVAKETHDKIHDYFVYLRKLGIVQINLLHLSDSAFGGMALYDYFFMINSWVRTGMNMLPAVEDGFTG